MNLPDPQKKSILLIGPLPPPWGGARVSFKLFYDYLQETAVSNIRHYDLPIRRARHAVTPGNVNHITTFAAFLPLLLRVPFSDAVVLFGSKNFCFTYGSLLSIICRIFRKPLRFRFFGGHPAKDLKNYPSIARRLIVKFLSWTEIILIETKTGFYELPTALQPNADVVWGYRPKIPDQKSENGTADGVTRFVYVGSIREEKGINTLVSAFSSAVKTANTELHVYGAGEPNLIEKLKEAEGIHFHGTVKNDVLRRKLLDYDAFVFPSVFENEGHSGAVIEAMMVGLPIIASNIPVLAEVITHESEGLLVEPRSAEDLSQAMLRLVSDEALQKRMARQSYIRSSQFDTAVVLPKLAQSLKIPVK